MPWQIQVRRKDVGTHWEPVTVERAVIVADRPERRFHYETLDEIKIAFASFFEQEGSLPNLIVRLATGRPKFTDLYDVRFVWISQPGIVWCPATVPEPKETTGSDISGGGFDKPPSTSSAGSDSALREGIAATLRACADSIIENRMEGPAAANYLIAYAAAVTQGPPTSRRPAENPRDRPNSTTERTVDFKERE